MIFSHINFTRGEGKKTYYFLIWKKTRIVTGLLTKLK